jgi:hypothetical protein
MSEEGKLDVEDWGSRTCDIKGSMSEDQIIGSRAILLGNEKLEESLCEFETSETRKARDSISVRLCR